MDLTYRGTRFEILHSWNNSLAHNTVRTNSFRRLAIYYSTRVRAELTSSLWASTAYKVGIECCTSLAEC